MKKLILILLCIAMPLTFFACKPKQTNLEKLDNYLSTYQTALYTASNNSFDIDIQTITQEEIFVIDGKIDKLICESKITLKPKSANLLNYEYSFKLFGSEGTIEGSLSKDLLGVSFSSTLENLESIGEISSVEIIYDTDKTSKYELTNVLKDKIDYKKALEIAYNNYQTKIDNLFNENNFNREIYIKLIKDKSNDESKYCYYVSFIKNSDDYFSSLIDLDGNTINNKVKP